MVGFFQGTVTGSEIVHNLPSGGTIFAQTTADLELEFWNEAAEAYGDPVVVESPGERVAVPNSKVRITTATTADVVLISSPISTAGPIDSEGVVLALEDMNSGQQEDAREALSLAATTTGDRPLNATKAFQWVIFGTPANGNTINVNGRILTKAAAVGADAFSTLAELVTKINEDAELYAYALDSKTAYVEAVTAGEAGNAIVLSSATFRCSYVAPPTPAPGFLVEGVNGTAATAPTYIEESNGDLWFTISNTISGSNWKRVAKLIDTNRPNSDPDFIGARPPANIVGSAGDVVLRKYNDFTAGNVIIPAYSDGETPMGRCVVPAFGQANYTAASFFGLAENVVGFPVNCEIGILGTKIRMFGRVHVEFGADLPGIWFAILGSTQTEYEQNVGLTTDVFPPETGKMVVDLDLEVEFKDATGNGPQGYESFYYLDVVQDRSLIYIEGEAMPTFGLGLVQRSSPVGANHHEPCGSADKEVGFAIGRVDDVAGVTTTKVTYRLYWEIIPPAIWQDA